MTTRRRFIRDTSILAASPFVSAAIRSAALAGADHPRNERILVVVQLDGGNDGINTIVPLNDDGYAQHRTELRLKSDRLIRVNEDVGLHPSLKPLAELLDRGELAVVQGVGYPNPNRSHDVSMAIWHTSKFDRVAHKSYGWIGKALDLQQAPKSADAQSILLSNENPPLALRGRTSRSVALAHMDDLQLTGTISFPKTPSIPQDDLVSFAQQAALDAQVASKRIAEVKTTASQPESYPATQLASQLKTIAQLIKSGFSTSVYYAIQPGYDTHAEQLYLHSSLLTELSGALHAFQEDLNQSGLAGQVVTVCFSEFGRRVAENASNGTDHGTAGPVLAMGPAVNAGFIGAAPSLTDLEHGDVRMQIDFRSVYAAILEDWMDVSSRSVLNGSFAPIDLFA